MSVAITAGSLTFPVCLLSSTPGHHFKRRYEPWPNLNAAASCKCAPLPISLLSQSIKGQRRLFNISPLLHTFILELTVVPLPSLCVFSVCACALLIPKKITLLSVTSLTFLSVKKQNLYVCCSLVCGYLSCVLRVFCLSVSSVCLLGVILSTPPPPDES